jgi:hypothetical protein
MWAGFSCRIHIEEINCKRHTLFCGRLRRSSPPSHPPQRQYFSYLFLRVSTLCVAKIHREEKMLYAIITVISNFKL